MALGRLAETPPHCPAVLTRAGAEAERNGRTAVAVAWDGVARRAVAVADADADADAVKETSAEAVRALRAPGFTPVLLTGDNRAVARR